jgi:hypothetical protein
MMGSWFGDGKESRFKIKSKEKQRKVLSGSFTFAPFNLKHHSTGCTLIMRYITSNPPFHRLRCSFKYLRQQLRPRVTTLLLVHACCVIYVFLIVTRQYNQVLLLEKEGNIGLLDWFSSSTI